MVKRAILWEDGLLSLVYIIIILLVLHFFSFRYKDLKLRRYFKLFFTAKIFSTLAFAFIHIYYYKGGDTFLYFSGGNFFVDNILQHPQHTFSYLFSSYEKLGHFSATNDYNISRFFKSSPMLFMSRLAFPFNLLGLKYFLASTLLFSLAMGIGHWLIFYTFYQLYPQLQKYLAWGILFFPTILVWNSGILKDTVILAALGFIFYAAYQLGHKKQVFLSILSIVISSYFCFKLKPYVLYLFIPAVLYWLQSLLKQSWKGSILNLVFTPLLLFSFVAGGFFFIQEISTGAGKYSFENLERTVEGFHSWHGRLAETRDQSGYDFGEIEFTPLGILKKAPASLFVTYFRPFPFVDTRNIPNWFEGMQSFILLLLSLYVVFKVGVLNSIRVIFKNKTLISLLFFALTFGFAVGFSTYNFGALSRYKTPALPFYTASLAIIYYEGLKAKTLGVLK